MGRVKEATAALQELKTTRVHSEKTEEHPCDTAFSNQAERLSHVCQDLSLQVKTDQHVPSDTGENEVSQQVMLNSLKLSDKFR